MLNFIRTKGKWVLSLGMVILVMVLGILGYYFFRIDESLIKNEVAIKRTVYGQEKSTGGLLSMNFNRDNGKYHYVNVAVDFNQDGKISSYQADNQIQQEWVVQNMEPKIKKDEGLGLAIPLTDLTIDNRENFPVKIIFSSKKLTNWQGEKKLGSAILSSTIKLIEKNDLSEIYQPDPDKRRSGGFFGDSFISNVRASENNIPDRPANINEEQEAVTGNNLSGEGPQGQAANKEKTVKSLAKEFDVSHNNMPDLDQKKNECAPTATANSLLWLAAKGDYLNKLPETAPELIAKLKTNLKWKETGVDVQKDFLEGKAATIKQFGLSLETHVVGNPFDLNIVSKIAQEIEKGQDVEIDLVYYKMNPDGTGERIGGHMVTVVGARGTRDAQYLDIHDPATKGENKTETYKINGSNVVDYTSGNTVTFIRYAFAESPITPPPATPSDSSTPTGTTTPTTTSTAPKEKFIYTRDTRPSIETGMIGEYTISKENSLNALKIKFKPTRQENVDKKINGVELTLADQNPPLPSNPTKMNTRVNSGAENADWTCQLLKGDSANKIQCKGTNTLELNKASFFDVFFETSVEQVNPLYLHFMSGGKVISAMNPIAK